MATSLKGKAVRSSRCNRYENQFVDSSAGNSIKRENGPAGKKIIDSSVMSAAQLVNSLKEINDADQGYFSLHMKATMMKISDPMIFGHAVSVYFKDVFEKHAQAFEQCGVNPDLALVDSVQQIKSLPADQQQQIETLRLRITGAALAMVDSDKGITNLHATNDIIIDASMPVVIRDGGKMYNNDGDLQDVKAVIPDRCYATMYQAVFEDCQKNGAFDLP